MRLYSDLPTRRRRQVVGDSLLVLWIMVWVWVATTVHDVTLALAGPGRSVEGSADDLAAQLREAGERVGGVPVVGDDVATPFDGAGDAAERIAAAGRAQVEAVETFAFWLAVVVALVPIVYVLVHYLPLRLRFVLRTLAADRLGLSPARDPRSAVGIVPQRPDPDLDLLALRGLTRQPLAAMAKVGPGAAAAWRRGDPDVVRALATLELRRLGLGAPPSETAATSGEAPWPHGRPHA